jgi:general secretion pathway protein G
MQSTRNDGTSPAIAGAWSNKARARSRGLTLVELVIVITILGVLTAAISVGLMAAKKQADIGTAKTACSSIRSATTMWKQAHPGEDCPTLEQLRHDKNLDRGFVTKDAWGNTYKLTCESDDIICTTAGPDKKEGTEDDIIVPAPDNAPGH